MRKTGGIFSRGRLAPSCFERLLGGERNYEDIKSAAQLASTTEGFRARGSP